MIHIIRLADPGEGGSESVKPADGAEISRKGHTVGDQPLVEIKPLTDKLMLKRKLTQGEGGKLLL